MTLTPFLAHDRALLLRGDCMSLTALLAPNSIDAIVTDPPAGISFMGKGWDGDKGGRDHWIAWLAERLRIAYALLKPGGYLLVWALPRTSHWTATAIEDAGFEIRDVVMHLFGQGFPKSLDLSKAIDARLGKERPVVGANPNHRPVSGAGYKGPSMGAAATGAPTITAPGSPEAARWHGWGTALKPAAEHWILARKPIEGTYAENLLKYGTGGLNIGGCRIGDEERFNPPAGNKGGTASYNMGVVGMPADASGREAVGRWPAHLVLDEEAAAVLDDQAGERKSGASRFFYIAKPSKREKETGIEHLTARTGGEATDREDGSAGLKNPRAGAGRGGGARNFHPTVKSTALMRWLCRLITPPGGIVLDMFMGSGSTAVAALEEGLSFIGCDLDEDEDRQPLGYMDINVGRARRALGLPPTTSAYADAGVAGPADAEQSAEAVRLDGMIPTENTL